MLRRRLLNLNGALGRRRVILPFFFLIFALLATTWSTLPSGTGRAENPATDVAPKLASDQETVRQGDLQIQKIQDLASRRPPQFTFMGPASGCLVKVPRPAFHWKLSGVPGEVQRVIYTLKVVELQSEQNLEDALSNNPPVFEKGNLIGTFFQPPERGSQFKPGKVYAWHVTASDVNGTELSKSSAAFFGYQYWSEPPCFLRGGYGPFDYCIPPEGGLKFAFAFMLGIRSWTLKPESGSGFGGSGSAASFDIIIPQDMLPKDPGTYKYTLIVTNGASCTKSTPITINVYAPAVGGSAVISPSPICDGGTAVLDVQGKSGNVVRWEYSDNDGPWFNATSDFSIAGAPANTNQMFRSNPHQPSSCIGGYTDRRFRAVVSSSTDPNAPSCSTTYSAPTTLPLRIYCKPVAGNLTASNPGFCKYPPPAPPESITLTMAGPIVGNISWSADPGGSIAGSGNTITVPAPTTTTTYTATVSTGGPCPTVSASVQVIVDDQPFCTSPGTALTVDKNIVCPGDAAVLTLSNCSGIVTWEQSLSGPLGPWSIPPISQGNSVQNTTDLYVKTWWRAVIKGPHGPPPSSCPDIISNVVFIDVMTPPPIPVVATPAPVCFGAPATLSSNLPPLSSLPPLPPPYTWTYQWYHDDLTIAACNNQPTCTFAPAEPGNYWVEVSNGCQTVQSNFVTLPVDIITVQLTAPCCGFHSSLTLSATANSSLSGAITNPGSYVWTVNGGVVGSGPNLTVNPATTTTYCVTVTSPTGCTEQSCTTITVCP